MTLFDGITARVLDTSRLSVNILEREGDDPNTPPERTVVFIHGNASSALFWQENMLHLPHDLRVLAIDLRGYGGTEHAPIDATRGVRDFSDDIAVTLEELGIPTAHLVGWSMGGGVILQYALDHPVLSLTLLSPISPYGFGGTRRDGSRLTADDAGTGAESRTPTSCSASMTTTSLPTPRPRPAASSAPATSPSGYTTEHEDVWVESMLSTSTADGNYPGDSVASDNWPGFAAGTTGVCNAMAPQYFDVSGIVGLDPEAAHRMGARHRGSDRVGHLLLRLQLPRAARHHPRTGPEPRSRPRRRWCRRPATCSTPTGRRWRRHRDRARGGRPLGASRGAGGVPPRHSHRDRLRRYAGGSLTRRRRRSSSSPRTDAAPVLAVTESAP